MTQKKSFIVHIDSLQVLDELNDEQAGKLFKAIKAHHNGSEIVLEFALKMAFLPFKNQFKRDEAKYANISQRNQINGNKPKRAKKADSDSKNGSDNDSKNKKENNLIVFDSFRKLYAGTKRGNETEFNNFVKKTEDWEIVLPTLKPCVERQIQAKEILKKAGGFVASWKDLATWINNRCWEQTFDITPPASPEKKVHESWND